MVFYKILGVFSLILSNSYVYSFTPSNVYGNSNINVPKSCVTANAIKQRAPVSNINLLTSEKYSLIDKILDIPIKEDKILGKMIVEQISSWLPHVDSIGHNILHANNEFVSLVLNSHMSEPAKKQIVLLSIKMAQMGDDMGSHLLQMYYDIVDKCL